MLRFSLRHGPEMKTTATSRFLFDSEETGGCRPREAELSKRFRSPREIVRTARHFTFERVPFLVSGVGPV